VTNDAVTSGAVPDRAQVVIVGGGVTGEIPARLQIAPPYDPQRLRILDR
jgi:hypothetical protein